MNTMLHKNLLGESEIRFLFDADPNSSDANLLSRLPPRRNGTCETRVERFGPTRRKQESDRESRIDFLSFEAEPSRARVAHVSSTFLPDSCVTCRRVEVRRTSNSTRPWSACFDVVVRRKERNGDKVWLAGSRKVRVRLAMSIAFRGAPEDGPRWVRRHVVDPPFGSRRSAGRKAKPREKGQRRSFLLLVVGIPFLFARSG